MSAPVERCSVCGGTAFTFTPVLWDSLIAEWQLSAAEAAFVDRQQGVHCDGCGCNLRSLALAKAVLSASNAGGTFRRFLCTPRAWLTRTLEINGAGTLTRLLRYLPRLTQTNYPEADMRKLPFADQSFDLVLHSDTLEHVPTPLQGLRECLRVLKPGGWCCFTVPIIPARMTRDREGLPPSYHGRAGIEDPGMTVATEFGADAWAMVMEAGFDECRLVTAEYPSAQAIAARRPR
jgi:SAM-dependent methyltransferase